MQTNFGALLEEVGTLLNLQLKPDHLNVCRISYPEGLDAQIEMNRDETRVLIGIKIGQIAPGRYRQDFLEQSLKANGKKLSKGVFSFTKKTGSLYLTQFLRAEGLSGAKLVDTLALLLEKAREWKLALNEGRIPVLEETGPSKGPKGMFGLVS